MEKVVSHMRVYYFDEDAPPIPAIENLIHEVFYNEQGLEVRRENIDETVEYFYERISSRLIREVHDYPGGKRKVTTFTYDHDANLVVCHMKEYQVKNGYGDYLIIPTGAFSEEYYDWSNKGKTCTRTKENHFTDGTVSKELRREEYKDLGWLRRVHHFDEDFQYESCEAMHYHYPDGILVLKMQRSVFTTKDGERREIRSRVRYAGDDMRVISEENYGVNAEGKLFSNEFFYECEDDEEGNWIVSRKLKNGKVQCTLVREIEYW